MSTLNLLPNGNLAPQYECTAKTEGGESHTVTLIEWWFEGKKVEDIEQSAAGYFYEYFDKQPFKLVECRPVANSQTGT